MEGISVFQFQIQEQRRNRSWWCLSIPRARLILMVAMISLFFLSWLIFNSVRLEIKDGRIPGIHGNEILHLEEFFSEISSMNESPNPPSEITAEEPVIKEDETEASFLSLSSLNDTKLGFVSLASNDSPLVPFPPPGHHFSTTATSPPPPPVNRRQIPDDQQHISNLIRALRGAGGFAGWANLLLSANITSLPVTATFFIPGNDAISHLPNSMIFDPLLIPYHILPHRHPFSHLQRFKLHARLPTLLPSKYILITNNSLSKFTIDDATITHPDIFQTPAFAVHGISKILKYSTYGDVSIPPPPMADPPSNNTPDDGGPEEMLMPPAEEAIITSITSGAEFLCTEFSVMFSVLLFLVSRFMGILG